MEFFLHWRCISQMLHVGFGPFWRIATYVRSFIWYFLGGGENRSRRCWDFHPSLQLSYHSAELVEGTGTPLSDKMAPELRNNDIKMKTICGIQDFFSTNWDALALNLVRSFPDLSPIQGPRPQLLWSPEDLELGPVVEVSLDRPHRVEEGSLNFCLTNQHQQMHLLYSNISSHSHWFWL